jgi:hypothetical protein
MTLNDHCLNTGNVAAPAQEIRPGLSCTIIRQGWNAGHRGPQYVATFDGEVIATSHDPEFTAARVLRDRGYSGPLQFFRPGNPESHLTMKDLVRVADYCATPDGRFMKYRPFDHAVRDRCATEPDEDQ